MDLIDSGVEYGGWDPSSIFGAPDYSSQQQQQQQLSSDMYDADSLHSHHHIERDREDDDVYGENYQTDGHQNKPLKTKVAPHRFEKDTDVFDNRDSGKSPPRINNFLDGGRVDNDSLKRLHPADVDESSNKSTFSAPQHRLPYGSKDVMGGVKGSNPTDISPRDDTEDANDAAGSASAFIKGNDIADSADSRTRQQIFLQAGDESNRSPPEQEVTNQLQDDQSLPEQDDTSQLQDDQSLPEQDDTSQQQDDQSLPEQDDTSQLQDDQSLPEQDDTSQQQDDQSLPEQDDTNQQQDDQSLPEQDDTNQQQDDQSLPDHEDSELLPPDPCDQSLPDHEDTEQLQDDRSNRLHAELENTEQLQDGRNGQSQQNGRVSPRKDSTSYVLDGQVSLQQRMPPQLHHRDAPSTGEGRSAQNESLSRFACTTIQRMYRGHLGRKKAAKVELKIERERLRSKQRKISESSRLSSHLPIDTIQDYPEDFEVTIHKAKKRYPVSLSPQSPVAARKKPPPPPRRNVISSHQKPEILCDKSSGGDVTPQLTIHTGQTSSRDDVDVPHFTPQKHRTPGNIPTTSRSELESPRLQSSSKEHDDYIDDDLDEEIAHIDRLFTQACDVFDRSEDSMDDHNERMSFGDDIAEDSLCSGENESNFGEDSLEEGYLKPTVGSSKTVQPAPISDRSSSSSKDTDKHMYKSNSNAKEPVRSHNAIPTITELRKIHNVDAHVPKEVHSARSGISMQPSSSRSAASQDESVASRHVSHPNQALRGNRFNAAALARRHAAAMAIQRVFRGHCARRQAVVRKEKMKNRFACPNCGMLEQGGMYCKRCGRKTIVEGGSNRSQISNKKQKKSARSESSLSEDAPAEKIVESRRRSKRQTRNKGRMDDDDAIRQLENDLNILHNGHNKSSQNEVDHKGKDASNRGDKPTRRDGKNGCKRKSADVRGTVGNDNDPSRREKGKKEHGNSVLNVNVEVDEQCNSPVKSSSSKPTRQKKQQSSKLAHPSDGPSKFKDSERQKKPTQFKHESSDSVPEQKRFFSKGNSGVLSPIQEITTGSGMGSEKSTPVSKKSKKTGFKKAGVASEIPLPFQVQSSTSDASHCNSGYSENNGYLVEFDRRAHGGGKKGRRDSRPPLMPHEIGKSDSQSAVTAGGYAEIHSAEYEESCSLPALSAHKSHNTRRVHSKPQRAPSSDQIEKSQDQKRFHSTQSAPPRMKNEDDFIHLPPPVRRSHDYGDLPIEHVLGNPKVRNSSVMRKGVKIDRKNNKIPKRK